MVQTPTLDLIRRGSPRVGRRGSETSSRFLANAAPRARGPRASFSIRGDEIGSSSEFGKWRPREPRRRLSRLFLAIQKSGLIRPTCRPFQSSAGEEWEFYPPSGP